MSNPHDFNLLVSTFTAWNFETGGPAMPKFCRANISRTETGHAVQDKEGYIERLVKHPAFDIFFTLIVITNSLFIGIELQVSVDNPEGPPPLAIQSMLYLYTFLFLLELVLRTAAGGLKYLFGEEWTWAWLDVFIVSTSLWEVTIQAPSRIMEVFP